LRGLPRCTSLYTKLISVRGHGQVNYMDLKTIERIARGKHGPNGDEIVTKATEKLKQNGWSFDQGSELAYLTPVIMGLSNS
jgi:hypothetical protein